MNAIPDSKEAVLPAPEGCKMVCHSEDLFWFIRSNDESSESSQADRTSSHNSHFLLTDQNGKVIKEFYAKKVRPFREGVSWVCFQGDNGNSWNLINQNGEIIPMKKNIVYARDFCEGVAWVKFNLEEDCLLINKEGQILLGEKAEKNEGEFIDEYILVTDFECGHAWVKIRPKSSNPETAEADKYVHLIDKKGRRVLKFKQKHLPNFMTVTIARGTVPKLKVTLNGIEGDVNVEDLLELSKTLATDENIPQDDIDMTPLTDPGSIARWLIKIREGVQRAISKLSTS